MSLTFCRARGCLLTDCIPIGSSVIDTSRGTGRSFGDCHATSRAWCRRERPEFPRFKSCSIRRTNGSNARAAASLCSTTHVLPGSVDILHDQKPQRPCRSQLGSLTVVLTWSRSLKSPLTARVLVALSSDRIRLHDDRAPLTARKFRELATGQSGSVMLAPLFIESFPASIAFRSFIGNVDVDITCP